MAGGGREGGAAPGEAPPGGFSFPHYRQRNTIASSARTDFSSRGSDFIHHPHGAEPRRLQTRMTLDIELVFLLLDVAIRILERGCWLGAPRATGVLLELRVP